jgi:hypothetical protein
MTFTIRDMAFSKADSSPKISPADRKQHNFCLIFPQEHIAKNLSSDNEKAIALARYPCSIAQPKPWLRATATPRFISLKRTASDNSLPLPLAQEGSVFQGMSHYPH